MRKAMILAAGDGRRLGAITQQIPKALVEVHGKPLIEYHIERLARAGISDIVINLGRLGHQIKARFADGANWGVSITYSNEEHEPLETGGGLVKALPLLGDEPFIVVNCDVLTDYAFSSLPQSLSGEAHLVMVNNPCFHPEGDFSLTPNQLVSPKHKVKPALTFSGISLYSPAFFAGQVPGKYSVVPLLKEKMRQGEVSGEHFRGLWFDVGTPERLQQLNQLPRATLARL
jgi:MurNAc alpha-1-phosphate uridylyltransferase